MTRPVTLLLALFAAAGCGGSDAPGGASPDAASDSGVEAASDGGVDAASDSGVDAAPLPDRCNGSIASSSAPATGLPAPPALAVDAALSLELVATVPKARELVALPNGDLLVGTSNTSVYLVPNAERDAGAGAPVVFTSVGDAPVQGVAFAGSSCTVYVASQHGVYAIPYVDAQHTGDAGSPIAQIRSGGIPPGSDGDVHKTTSVAVGDGKLFAGVGSSCNACTEIDPTRATIQQMDPDGSNMTTRATRMRNAIALAVNPATGTLWAGGAGQDSLPLGHPYEYFDAVGVHPGVADYGWPACEENQHAYTSGADCSGTLAPRIELPAYSTIIGAAFYPSQPGGAHALPASYRGGVFLTAHGSWHKTNGSYFTPPRVVFVALSGDVPADARGLVGSGQAVAGDHRRLPARRRRDADRATDGDRRRARRQPVHRRRSERCRVSRASQALIAAGCWPRDTAPDRHFQRRNVVHADPALADNSGGT